MADGTHAVDAPATTRVTFFASGSNHSGEIRALSLIDGAHVGVVAGRVAPRRYPAAWAELERFVETGRKVFIDSGAFGEVTFPGGKPTITKPLSDADWREIFHVYAEAALTHGENAYVVAPDCVAHQTESLSRLAHYADEVRDIHGLGATILVPIQKGALSMAAFYDAARRLLNGAPLAGETAEGFYNGVDFTPSIPMKKDATTLGELQAFVEAVRPASIHLLGLAPDTDEGQAAIGTVLAIVPACRVSCDACLIMRWVGKSNGPGGGTRRLTSMNELHAAKLALDPEGLDDAWTIDGKHKRGLGRKLNETHVRKLISFFLSARCFWTDLGLAEPTLPEHVDAPEGELEATEPYLLPLALAVWGRR